MHNSDLNYLYADKNLIFEFLATFSRFEYALKTAGYYLINKKRYEAKADWGKFTEEVSQNLNLEMSNKLKEAFSFILSYNLKLLGEIGNKSKLDWITFEIDENESDLSKVIRKIKQIRNNTFHGGKFLKPSENVDNNTLLLKHSLTVLIEIKNLSKSVQDAYEN